MELIKKHNLFPYGRQSIDEKDIASVCSVLRSDYLTTGPKVEEFEQAVCRYIDTRHGIAVSSGTAALHCAMYALNIGSGDEVIVSSMTFAATANCVCFMGATPVFVDVEPDTLLIDPEKIKALVTPKTKAIIGVDYAGQPCDWDHLRTIANKYDLALVADSCHAIGAEYKGRKVGTLADMTVFSFHPVKHITTGEGGMIVTDNEECAQKMRLFRNHGITIDAMNKEKNGAWFYEMIDLGYNYRITDIQCALGISQLKKLPEWVRRRQAIAFTYSQFFSETKLAKPLKVRKSIQHAYHLYVVRIIKRDEILLKLRENGIGVNVHYMPVHLHPFYQQKFGYKKGLCPIAEDAYKDIISLPLWPGMEENDILHINNFFKKIMNRI
ncbi:MAG: UDP-4-amino-4,6-dideoxy-N-acetyl-beta-L-altrosamine transaminase [Desulfobacterales bacterium]|nr:UDP-4-amino-4,6-dideoxy-N-acetyl-beta-L-altrosamine transaminase [Desulfobacterales bacterium]